VSVPSLGSLLWVEWDEENGREVGTGETMAPQQRLAPSVVWALEPRGTIIVRPQGATEAGVRQIQGDSQPHRHLQAAILTSGVEGAAWPLR
jgi:hypothetical protein